MKGWYLKRAPHSLQIAICRRDLAYYHLTAQKHSSLIDPERQIECTLFSTTVTNLVTSQPLPTCTRQHGPDVHLIFIYHMAEESTNDDGTEEVRVVGHGDKHEPE